MTFRYTFEEKVEVEVLPFRRKDGKQPVLFTVMHFGPPETLAVSIGKYLQVDFLNVRNGLQVFE